MHHHDRNTHAQLRATAHRSRLAEHDACCTGRETRSTARERRQTALITRWSLALGTVAAVILAAIR